MCSSILVHTLDIEIRLLFSGLSVGGRSGALAFSVHIGGHVFEMCYVFNAWVSPSKCL